MKYVLIVIAMSMGNPTGMDVYGVFTEDECKYAQGIVPKFYEQTVVTSCRELIMRSDK